MGREVAAMVVRAERARVAETAGEREVAEMVAEMVAATVEVKGAPHSSAVGSARWRKDMRKLQASRSRRSGSCRR